MPVKAINVPASKPVYTPASVEDAVREHTAACVAAMLSGNVPEGARALARARIAGLDMAALQVRCFDADVPGALLRKAWALSQTHTAASLAKGDAAVKALEVAARENARQRAREAARERAETPLTFKAFAGLTLR